MGLDTYIHTLTGKTYKEFDEDRSGVQVFVISPEWEDRISDLEKDVWYESDGGAHMTSYSYSTHGRFRQALADVAHGGCQWLDVDEGPFVKLIQFADNEGAITWTTAGQLAKDFRRFETAFRKMFADNDWMLSIYNEWMKGCETCAIEKGVIEFC